MRTPPYPPWPAFTLDELRAIHNVLHHLSWNPERFYDERRSAVNKLRALFGTDDAHLRGKNL